MTLNDPFFIGGGAKTISAKRKRTKTKPKVDESDSDQNVNALDDLDLVQQASEADSSEDEKETAQEKRVRLAKQYLDKIEKDMGKN
jgi:ribosomal RNA-processing protein 9